MGDRIHVHDLLLRAVIGVHDWERETKQDVRINLVLDVDLGPASRSDDLADSIADLALAEFPKLRAITVKVDKPGALRFARSVAVEIRRERG